MKIVVMLKIMVNLLQLILKVIVNVKLKVVIVTQVILVSVGIGFSSSSDDDFQIKSKIREFLQYMFFCYYNDIKKIHYIVTLSVSLHLFIYFILKLHGSIKTYL